MKRPIPQEALPKHVAVIMDGNGRWARARRRPRVWGHRRGADRVREIIETSAQWGLQALTLFAFSEENWGRPKEEVAALMKLLEQYLKKERPLLKRNNVSLRFVGDLQRLPLSTQKVVEETTAYLKDSTGLVATVALSYSGRWDIVAATRKIAADVQAGKLRPEDIENQLFASYLSTSGIPEPDLLIRTSGEQRISNFLLWQCAYSEFYFTETFWPDFDAVEYGKALIAYHGRQRRFGLTMNPEILPLTENWPIHAESSVASEPVLGSLC